jgi:hypothetical protein
MSQGYLRTAGYAESSHTPFPSTEMLWPGTKADVMSKDVNVVTLSQDRYSKFSASLRANVELYK